MTGKSKAAPLFALFRRAPDAETTHSTFVVIFDNARIELENDTTNPADRLDQRRA
jgi:hypothetical protein